MDRLLDLFGYGALLFEMNYPPEDVSVPPPVVAVEDADEPDAGITSPRRRRKGTADA